MSTIRAEVKLVRIEETVLMKILKHANSQQDEEESIIGRLMGYYDEQSEIIEIGTAYPLPQDRQVEYLQEMTSRLDQVNVDNFDVGWYQISQKSNHLINFGAFEAHKDFQLTNPHGIYLVYDVLAAKNGDVMPFKAYRLNEQFIELFNSEKVNQEDLKKYSSQYDHVFMPVTLEISRSPLTQAFLNMYGKDIRENYTSKQINHPCYDFGYEFVKNSEYLIDALQDLSDENLRNMEVLREQKQLVEQKKQQHVQVNSKKFIDTKFINERVRNISDLVNHQTEVNQASQKVIECLKQN